MRKRIFSILMICVVALSFVACSDKKENTTATALAEKSKEENYLYNITACLSDDNTYNDVIYQGFSDALVDYCGKEHVKITKRAVGDEQKANDVVATAIKTNPDMLFTVGSDTLLAASSKTSTIPIIAAGVVDFRGTLRIADSGATKWDKLIGTNITGVSSKPPIDAQLSVMIEACDRLQNVALLFSPEDTDSIYQNEIFEKYLDEAGIPWKEYCIPATEIAVEDEKDEKQDILPPDKFVADSAKAGMDNEVMSLGEDVIIGINSKMSTRVAKVSKNWKHGKIEIDSSSDTVENDSSKTDKSDFEVKNLDTDDCFDIAADVSLEARVNQICRECSAIFIPYQSMLTDQLETICSIANEAQVVTVGGDEEIGAYTLVSAFSDPYDLGYRAGKKAYSVLSGTDISTIKVSNGSGDNIVKLYNASVAELFSKEFPKSFKEREEFLSSYEYGSMTKRHVSEEEDEQE